MGAAAAAALVLHVWVLVGELHDAWAIFEFHKVAMIEVPHVVREIHSVAKQLSSSSIGHEQIHHIIGPVGEILRHVESVVDCVLEDLILDLRRVRGWVSFVYLHTIECDVMNQLFKISLGVIYRCFINSSIQALDLHCTCSEIKKVFRPHIIGIVVDHSVDSISNFHGHVRDYFILSKADAQWVPSIYTTASDDSS